jgi:hypothetical protein
MSYQTARYDSHGSRSGSVYSQQKNVNLSILLFWYTVYTSKALVILSYMIIWLIRLYVKTYLSEWALQFDSNSEQFKCNSYCISYPQDIRPCCLLSTLINISALKQLRLQPWSFLESWVSFLFLNPWSLP